MSLKKERIRQNRTQEYMSKRLKVATSTYNQYENGIRDIPSELVYQICGILNIDKDEFFLPTKFTVSK